MGFNLNLLSLGKICFFEYVQEKKSSILSPPSDLNAEDLNKQKLDVDGDVEMKNMENNNNNNNSADNQNDKINDNNVITKNAVAPPKLMNNDMTKLDISTNESNANDKNGESNANDENKKMKMEGNLSKAILKKL